MRFHVWLVVTVTGLYAAVRLFSGETINGWLLFLIAVVMGIAGSIPIGTFIMKKWADWPFCPRDNQARRYRILIGCIGFFLVLAFSANRFISISATQTVQASLVSKSSNLHFGNEGIFERSGTEYDFRVRLKGFSDGNVGDLYELQIRTGLLGFDVAIDAIRL